jgi:hypothetical protein
MVGGYFRLGGLGSHGHVRQALVDGVALNLVLLLQRRRLRLPAATGGVLLLTEVGRAGRRLIACQTRGANWLPTNRRLLLESTLIRRRRSRVVVVVVVVACGGCCCAWACYGSSGVYL